MRDNMSSTKLNVEGIDAFIAKVRQAGRTGSKELRLPMAEANDLVAAIGQVLQRNVSLSDDLRETQKLLGSTIRLDGGSFG
jgi:hypothetical protein